MTDIICASFWFLPFHANITWSKPLQLAHCQQDSWSSYPFLLPIASFFFFFFCGSDVVSTHSHVLVQAPQWKPLLIVSNINQLLYHEQDLEIHVSFICNKNENFALFFPQQYRWGCLHPQFKSMQKRLLKTSRTKCVQNMTDIKGKSSWCHSCHVLQLVKLTLCSDITGKHLS